MVLTESCPPFNVDKTVFSVLVKPPPVPCPRPKSFGERSLSSGRRGVTVHRHVLGPNKKWETGGRRSVGYLCPSLVGIITCFTGLKDLVPLYFYIVTLECWDFDREPILSVRQSSR